MRSSVAKFLLALLTSLLLVLGVAPVLTPSAQAAPGDPVTLTGSVASPAAEPVASGGVRLHQRVDGVWSLQQEGSLADGSYSLADVPSPGTYTIEAWGYVGDDFVEGFLGGGTSPETATTFEVLAEEGGTTVTAPDVVLEVHVTSVGGKVESQLGEAVTSGGARLYQFVDNAWTSLPDVSLDASGAYAVDNVPYPGTFTLEAWGYVGDDYVQGFLGGGTTPETATPFELPATHTYNQTFSAPTVVLDVRATTVAGTVLSRAGDPVTSGGVQLYHFVDNAWSALPEVSLVDGSYTVENVPFPGTFTLKAWGYAGGRYVEGFLGGGTSPQTATPFQIESTHPYNTTFTAPAMVVGANSTSVSGTVVSPAGVAMSSGHATLYRLVDDSWASVDYVSVTDGTYTFDGVAFPGTYTVGADGYFGDSYASGYLGGAADLETATSFSISESHDEQATFAAPDLVVNVPYTAVTGTVHTAGGQPVSGSVTLYQQVDGAWTAVAYAGAENGNYAFSAVPYPGTYTVEVSGSAGDLPVYGFLGGASTPEAADTFAITSDHPHDVAFEAPAMTLSTGHGAVTGTVTDTAGAPMANVDVVLWRASESGSEWVTSTTTDDAGHYALAVEPGRYTAQFAHAQYYGGATSIDGATFFDVVADATVSGIDATLDVVRVEGTATTSLAGEVDYAYATLYRMTSDGFFDWVATEAIDLATGAYSFPMVGAPGTYTVGAQFTFVDGSSYVGYLGDIGSLYDAQRFDVAAGSGAPVDLAPITVRRYGGTVSGTVTDFAGNPVPNAFVELREWDAEYEYWAYVDEGYADSSGNYALSAWDDGRYVVGAQHPDSVDGTFFYYGGGNDPSSATPIDLVGTDHTGIDFQTAPSTYVSLDGAVTDAAGAPLGDASVTLYRKTAHGWSWQGDDYTDAAGRYAFTEVIAPGEYTVGGYYYSSEGPTLEGYLGGAYDIADADTFVVPAGHEGTFTAPALALSNQRGTVGGTVRDEASAPVADTVVTIYRGHDYGDGTLTYEFWDSEWTDETGVWDSQVPPGKYKFSVADPDDRSIVSYYEGASTLAAATVVPVASESTTTVDMTLPTVPKVAVAGSVTDAAGSPVLGASVTLYRKVEGDLDYVAHAYGDDAGETAGAFRFPAVGVPGEFTLYGEGWTADGLYVSGYLGPAADASSASTFSIPAEQTETFTAPALQLTATDGVMSGAVTNPSGTPLEDIRVVIHSFDSWTSTWEPWRSTYTDTDGTWRAALEPGDYRVEFYDYALPEERVFYDGAADVESATTVSVTAGAVVRDIDAVLDIPNRVGATGVVTAGGDPLALAEVSLYRVFDDGSREWIDYDYSDSDGSYQFESLFAGRSYTLGATFDGVTTYLGGGSDLSTADVVTIPAEQVDPITIPTIALPTEGRSTIGGSVIAANGAPLAETDVTLLRVTESGAEPIRDASTGADGRYRFPFVLGPGEFTILATHDGVSRFLGGATTVEEASRVVLTESSSTQEADVIQLPVLARGAVISNGTVSLGVNRLGQLNYADVGLQFDATGNDSTFPGCECEGWGVADRRTGVTGYANNSVGIDGLEAVDFVATESTATATTRVGGTFEVVHDYRPSAASPNLYAVTVSVKNISTQRAEVSYRRVMDWDVEPTPFEEYVTMVKGTSPELVRTSNDGFASADPLSGDDGSLTGSWTDSGPDDHGALFDFDFGDLAAGESKVFHTFYGAAGDEKAALDALSAVRAEAYSLGQPSTTDGPTLGTPNTFAFGFAGVGGEAIILPPTAVDDTLVTEAGVATTINVLANDSDPNGDDITLESVADPAHGAVTFGASGEVTYTPDADFTGSDSFTYVVSDGNDTAVGTVRVTVNAGVAATNTAPPTITGTATVFETLTAQPGTWTPSEGVGFAYQWLRNGSAISGAEAASYTLVAEDRGQSITVRVTASRAGASPVSKTASPVTPAAASAPSVVAPPAIPAVIRVGDRVVALPGEYDPGAGAVHSYTWKRGTTVVGTSRSYIVPADDLGQSLTVEVRTEVPGREARTATSNAVVVSPGAAPRLVNRPTVTGTASPGSTLTATPGTWSPTDVTTGYQWLVGGTAQPGATGSTFVVPADTADGVEIAVRVTATRAGREPGTATSEPVVVDASVPVNTALPVITRAGTPLGDAAPKVQETLGVQPGTWNATVTRSYRWYVEIPGWWAYPFATGETVEVPDWAAGYQIKVEETATKASGGAGSATSVLTAPAEDVPTLYTSQTPSSPDAPRVGSETSVVTDGWYSYNPDGSTTGVPSGELTFNYRWYVDWVERGNGSTFTPVAGDRGRDLYVEVTATKDGFRDGQTWAYFGRILGADETTGQVTLTVLKDDAPRRVAPNTPVYVCPVDGWDCRWATTDDSGRATVSASAPVAGTEYTATAYPSSDSGFLETSRRVTLAGGTTSEYDLLLNQVSLPPDGTTLSAPVGSTEVDTDGDGTPDGSYPTVYYSTPQELKVVGKPGVANPTWTVTFSDGTTQTGTMTESPAGTYTGTIPGFDRTGRSTITTNIPPADGDEPITFTVYVDPSGHVTDQYGVPIPGATVTLQRLVDGTFQPVADGDETIMDPSTAEHGGLGAQNPGLTDEDGFFRWDVAKDNTYRVVASGAASGGVSCADFTTPGMTVEPMRVNLLLKMSCTGADAPEPTVEPVVTGGTTLGSTLTATPGTWDHDIVAFGDIVWLRDGEQVGTGSTYELTEADLGSEVTARFTQRRRDYVQDTDGDRSLVTFEAFSVDVATEVPTGTLQATPAKITGTAAAGKVLTLGGAAFTPSTATRKIQWYVDSKPISGATAATYKVPAAHGGRTISAKVTGTLAGYDTLTVSAAGKRIAAANTAKPAVSGIVKVGKIVKALKGTWYAVGYGFRYQWLANGKAIRGATKTSFKIPKALKGKLLAVRVTAVKAGWPTVTATSAGKRIR